MTPPDKLPTIGVVAGQLVAEPEQALTTVLSELRARRPAPQVTLFRGMSLLAPAVIPQDPRFRVLSTGLLGSNRDMWKRQQLDVLPEGVGRVPSLLRSGTIRNDVLVLRVARTAGGDYTTGTISDYLQAATETATEIVAEVCPELPSLPGAVTIPKDRLRRVVEDAPPPPEMLVGEPTLEDRQIARNVAAIVDDGDCIQIGVGGLAIAVAQELAEQRHDLGIHSGLIDDGVLALIDSGAVTNARKAIDRGYSVSPVVAGSRDLYRRLHGRKDIVLAPVDYTNDPLVISQLDNVVTINSALEVDLLGQTNAEIAGRQRISAVGGQLEWCTGAAKSKGGKVIITIRATAKGGQVSRIVGALAGACVTVPSSLVHFVVSEHGTADLRGATLDERMRRIVAVAHPAFRRDLLEQAASDSRLGAVARDPTP